MVSVAHCIHRNDFNILWVQIFVHIVIENFWHFVRFPLCNWVRSRKLALTFCFVCFSCRLSRHWCYRLGAEALPSSCAPRNVDLLHAWKCTFPLVAYHVCYFLLMLFILLYVCNFWITSCLYNSLYIYLLYIYTLYMYFFWWSYNEADTLVSSCLHICEATSYACCRCIHQSWPLGRPRGSGLFALRSSWSYLLISLVLQFSCKSLGSMGSIILHNPHNFGGKLKALHRFGQISLHFCSLICVPCFSRGPATLRHSTVG